MRTVVLAREIEKRCRQKRRGGKTNLCHTEGVVHRVTGTE